MEDCCRFFSSAKTFFKSIIRTRKLQLKKPDHVGVEHVIYVADDLPITILDIQLPRSPPCIYLMRVVDRLQLLRAPALPLIDRLRLLLTASDILRGQGEALNVDRRDFYVQLYEALGLTPYAQISEDLPSAGGWVVDCGWSADQYNGR